MNIDYDPEVEIPPTGNQLLDLLNNIIDPGGSVGTHFRLP